MAMFDQCDFLLGGAQSVAIVIPAKLPMAETYTVSISETDVRFRAGHHEIAKISYKNNDVFTRLSALSQVGMVEYPNGTPFPDCITALAYVEVRRSVQ